MRKWIDAVLLVTLVVVVAVTAATSLPALSDGDALEGKSLRLHMLASGLLVVGLPAVGLWFLGRGVGGTRFSRSARAGYWLLLASGWITIGSVYVCMVPVVSTDQMHPWIELHGYAGYTMVAATLMLVLGRPGRDGAVR